MKDVNALPVATVLAVLFALIGGIVVVLDNLSFKEYLEAMAVMIGLLGVGRGLAAKSVH